MTRFSSTERASILFWVVLVLCVVALVASALLLVDYVRPSPVFCGAEGGCGAAKRSAFAYPLGIPMPAIGITGILAVAVLAMIPGRRVRMVQAVFAGVGAVVAAALLGWQLTNGSICPYCATVDGATVALGIASVLAAWKGAEPPRSGIALAAGAALLVAAVGIPLGVGFTSKPLPERVPEAILAEIERTPKGKVTIIDFVDYECPFCRATHAELVPLLEKNAGKVRLVRKNVPLRMHPHAMDAAKGAACGEKLGKADAMADALMAAPVPGLTPDGIKAIAKSIGLDETAFAACVAAPETEAAVNADIATFKAAKGHGLPTLWFDTNRLEGGQERADLEVALEGALRAH